MKKIVYIVCGGTASGKSAYAIDLAEKKGGVIINCDSLQIYKSLPVLTASPDKKEKAVVGHRLFNFISGEDELKDFSVDFLCKKIANEIKNCFKIGKVPIVCGGTAFYIKTLINGISPLPEINDDDKKRVMAKYSAMDNKQLQDELEEKDPKFYQKVDKKNNVRLIRALTIIETTGKKVSYLHGLAKKKYVSDDIKFHLIMIDPNREIVYKKISDRFHKMVELGAIGEVQSFYDEHHFEGKTGVMKAIGANEILCFLKNECSLEEAILASISATKKYYRRQQTFLKQQLKFNEIVE